MSDDPEQEHFTDGITDDIITDLAKIGGLAVVARNSVFTYKNRAVKISDVGRELGVRYVLEGSVRKVGDQVRITAQLVDADAGRHLWAERYDRDLNDVFAVQGELSQKITGALKEILTTGEHMDAGSKRITDKVWRSTLPTGQPAKSAAASVPAWPATAATGRSHRASPNTRSRCRTATSSGSMSPARGSGGC